MAFRPMDAFNVRWTKIPEDEAFIDSPHFVSVLTWIPENWGHCYGEILVDRRIGPDQLLPRAVVRTRDERVVGVWRIHAKWIIPPDTVERIDRHLEKILAKRRKIG